MGLGDRTQQWKDRMRLTTAQHAINKHKMYIASCCSTVIVASCSRGVMMSLSSTSPSEWEVWACRHETAL